MFFSDDDHCADNPGYKKRGKGPGAYTHPFSFSAGWFFIEVLNFEQSGWDQQMSYTWFSDRWILPAPYYKTSVVYKEGN